MVAADINLTSAATSLLRPKWVINAVCRLSKPLWPFSRGVKVIFQTDAELAGDHQHWLIRKTHMFC